MPVSAPPGPRSRATRALYLIPLLALLATGCASASGAEPGADPTAAIPLPGPDDGSSDEGSPGTADGGDGAHEPVGDGPLHDRVVVIDPGHNGGNAEASSEINRLVPAGPQQKACDTVGAETGSGYPEHLFNWELSLLVKERLEADGATVILTREDDEGVGPCINERAEIGNEADADAALSIHADGGPETGRGFHVIVPGEVEGYTEEIVEPSRELAEDLRREYREGTDIPYADYLAQDGLDERTDLGGLNMSTVPKVFLEAGNMRNPEDAALLEDPQWQERAANSIARALAVYLLRE
ncbi:N-acetylmuramoyl-L-alanine amidase [Nocardiopsis changdeensis]|uniref:N-acetylmuramoyl-L-alanine amidase n=1 Tax=Nocardiopsis changdeensis TaxID=2831969 RepID=A0ABX8BM95_9ACTN|nr:MULTISPECIES: N-acetylmuramoyl-L-alanine amidase [Nocardiopsis]QUX23296.1 N-acetylmuramoyl-L-alanine amidase [Nocardiopsis changdeensis]QYX39238.1 N-acetylmuramoyl-L-alanine amidase [Nocardiopsis sp. MT53]